MPTSFSIPADVRRLARAKAAADGLSLASVVRILLTSYAAGRITIAATPVGDALVVERVEEIPLDPGTRTLADNAFDAVRKHARR